MVKADFLTSLVLIALGIAVAIESWRMPRLAELGVNPYTVPGLVPGLLGGVLIILGAILCLRSLQAGLTTQTTKTQTHAGDRISPAWRRLGLCLVLTVGYAAGLLGRLPFWLATLLFVFVFIALFENLFKYRDSWPVSAALLLRRLASALLQAVVVSALVTAVFRYLFLVQLP